MKPAFGITLLLLIFNLAIAQSSREFHHVDSVALTIPEPLTYSTDEISAWVNERFEKNKDRLRAYFTWLAHHIAYDLKDNRDSLAEDELDEFIEGTLIWRKGRCQAYAEVMHELCTKSGIPSQVVSGVVIPFPGEPLATHAWIAAFYDDDWHLIDPTYAAGYVIDNQFNREFDDAFFDSDPDEIIKTHYPYDPIWQMKSYPASMTSFFRKPDTLLTGQLFFNFNDSIQHHLSLPKKEQYIAIKRRALVWCENIPIVNDYIKNLNRHIHHYDRQSIIDHFNQYADTYSRMVEKYNQSVAKKKFEQLNATERNAVQIALSEIQDTLRKTRNHLIELDIRDEDLDEAVMDLNLAISDLLNQAKTASKSLERLR